MNQERPSDVPYSVSDAGCLVFRNGRGVVNFDSRRDAINAASLANRSHAEGRKAAESYTAKMLKSATDEVRRCHEEIRRLEDKYARNFYRMPVSLDEESAKKVAQDLKELLEFVNRTMEFFKHYTYCPRCKSDIDHTFECEVENAADSVLINFSRKCIDDFYVWKKARGIE